MSGRRQTDYEQWLMTGLRWLSERRETLTKIASSDVKCRSMYEPLPDYVRRALGFHKPVREILGRSSFNFCMIFYVVL